MQVLIVAADKEQPLVTSMSADTMHLEAAAVVDIVNMCSGPEGCSVAALLQCIQKGGLQVENTVLGACKLFCISCHVVQAYAGEKNQHILRVL